MKWPSMALFVQALLLHASCDGFQIPSLRSAPRVHDTTIDAATALPVDSGLVAGQDNSESKIGVLLLNLGGPETGDDVEGG